MSGTNDNNNVLYLHITPSGKKYFGITSQKPKYRWNNGNGYKSNPHFWRAIEKYGWDNITHIILADDLIEEEADLFEKFLIAYYDSTDKNKGYNIASGGRRYFHHSEETLRKIRENLPDRKGENNPWYGKHPSEETRKKMSENHADFKGKNSTLSKTVICITTGEVFYGISEAGRMTGTTLQNISKVCKGKRNYAGKLPDGTPLRWAYVKNLPKPQVTEEKKQLLRNGPKLLKSA
jgi:group I intron endonuclease